MKETYNNILDLIKINESIKFNCNNALIDIQQFLVKQGPKGYSTGTSYVDADCVHSGKSEIGATELARMGENIGLIRSIIEKQDQVLKELYFLRDDIDEKMKGLKGIPKEVAYYKLVEGYTLAQIADELHISLGYVKNISAKI